MTVSGAERDRHWRARHRDIALEPSRRLVRRQERAVSCADPDCHEPPGFGRTKLFCEFHAMMLAKVADREFGPGRPGFRKHSAGWQKQAIAGTAGTVRRDEAA